MQFETIKDIIDIIETKTGKQCYYDKQEVKSDEDCFQIEELSSELHFADDSAYQQVIDLQITFCTKKVYKKMDFNSFMITNFNCPFTTSYQDDEEWYRTVYLFSTIIKI